MIKYRVRFDRIEKIEVAKETDISIVFLDGSREIKQSSWYTWHDSFEDAKNYLVNKQEKAVKSMYINLRHAEGYLGQLKGMREEDIKSI